MLKIGDVFDDKYVIEKIIGKGGMSVVYKAQNTKLGNSWAIKEVKKNIKGKKLNYLGEPNLLMNLQHPMLPRIVDIKDEPDSEYCYIVMDFIEGKNLDAILKERGKIPEKEVREWAGQICSVLEYLHGQQKPIIYRDMKPANLMLQSDGMLRLIDFGIAREYKLDKQEDTDIIGTRGFAAPEQFGRNQTDARSDIFSLGVTLYSLLTGEDPNNLLYDFKPLRELDKNISRGMEYIVGKCTRNNPDERYQNAYELYKDLTEIDKLDSQYKKYKNIKTALFSLFAVLYVAIFAAGYYGFSMFREDVIDNYASICENARMLSISKKYDEAEKELDRAIALVPMGYDAQIQKARLLYKQTRYEDCISYIEGSLMGQEFSDMSYTLEKEAEVLNLLSLAYLNIGRPDMATYYAERAIAKDDSKTQYYIDLAISAVRDNNYNLAEKTLTKAKTRGASEEEITLIEGQIYIESDRAVDGEKALLSLCDERVSVRNRLRAYLILGKYYNENGRKKDVIILMEDGLAMEDLRGTPQMLESLADAYAYFGKTDISYYKKAMGCYQELIDEGYSRYYIYDNLAKLQQSSNDINGAKQTMEKAKEIYPDDYRPYIRLVSILNQEVGKMHILDRDYSELKANYDIGIELYNEYFEKTQTMSQEVELAKNLVSELERNGWLDSDI